MKTRIGIEGDDFLINGVKTYRGVEHQGRRVEGLLFNSRMIQAIFDDECPDTSGVWAYPDTGRWDPQRNVNEFCAALPEYRRHGLLGVTVGLQGGGSVYTPFPYNQTITSAFRPDGTLKSAWLNRLYQVLRAADDCGMVVIVNYFYWRQERFENDAAICRATEAITQWLLATGFGNVIVDVKNEIQDADGLLSSRGIATLLDIVRQQKLDRRRLLVGVSTHPKAYLPSGAWPSLVDLFMPHGNDQFPEQWRSELRALRDSQFYKSAPRPICCNEDSIDIANLEVCLDEHCSWGLYDQGYGCGQRQIKHDWSAKPRETRYEDLSGFQTVPVNWSINTMHKRAFFHRVAEITQGR